MTIFSGLSERLSATFGKWSKRGRLKASDVEDGLREIRIALFEADVNLTVAGDFLERVRGKALGTHILASLDPAKMLVKVVKDEMVELLGGKDAAPPDELSGSFNPILLLGLQGSGKTTTAAKLALHFKKKGKHTMLAALDMSRPAAIDQLEILGSGIGVPVFTAPESAPVDAARSAVERARKEGVHVLVLDTAGRLQIDEELMSDLREISGIVKPSESYIVVDAMTGQDAVRVVETFDREIGITGIIITKFDGDARAGAALSVKSVTGKPIRWVGTGEKVEMLEPFIPERMAGRILGMGDVLGLIEKAEEEVDREEAERLAESFGEGKFDVNDFLGALTQMGRLGPVKQLLGMIPGVNVTDDMVDTGEERLKAVKAISQSMTIKERGNPDMLDSSRKRRIAAGSGTTVDDVDGFLEQFGQMQAMMKNMSASGRGGELRLGDGGIGAPVDLLGGGALSSGLSIGKSGGKSKAEKAKAKAQKKAKKLARKRKKKRK